MTASISIPENLAKLHGVKSADVTASSSAEQIGKSWVKRFKEYGGLTGDQRILDIGCGSGRMAVAIGDEFGFSNPYIGFDVDAAQISFCREAISSKHPNFSFDHTDLNNILYNPKAKSLAKDFKFPAEDRSIDFCFATSVFTHMFTRDILRYIAEAHRVLAPSGVFLSTWFCIDSITKDALNEGTARFSFKKTHWLNQYFVAHEKNPAKAVAYKRLVATWMLRLCGFSKITFHRGCWDGKTQSGHSQDVVVARR